MQKIVIVANGAPYGSESLFNSLRLAIALREQESNLDLRLFLMSDAVTAGLRGQKPGEGYNIQQNAGDPYRSECTGEIVQNLY
ncbi:putative ACR involved in intracellular sulfur reduction [Escherichia coli]|nr:putative ACR involved in intracellular sulfur reduction [Escherichia coli]